MMISARAVWAKGSETLKQCGCATCRSRTATAWLACTSAKQVNVACRLRSEAYRRCERKPGEATSSRHAASRAHWTEKARGLNCRRAGSTISKGSSIAKILPHFANLSMKILICNLE